MSKKMREAEGINQESIKFWENTIKVVTVLTTCAEKKKQSNGFFFFFFF